MMPQKIQSRLKNLKILPTTIRIQADCNFRTEDEILLFNHLFRYCIPLII